MHLILNEEARDLCSWPRAGRFKTWTFFITMYKVCLLGKPIEHTQPSLRTGSGPVTTRSLSYTLTYPGRSRGLESGHIRGKVPVVTVRPPLKSATDLRSIRKCFDYTDSKRKQIGIRGFECRCRSVPGVETLAGRWAPWGRAYWRVHYRRLGIYGIRKPSAIDGGRVIHHLHMSALSFTVSHTTLDLEVSLVALIGFGNRSRCIMHYVRNARVRPARSSRSDV